MPFKPPSFPLQSIQQVEAFNTITDEEYENAVNFPQIYKHGIITKRKYKFSVIITKYKIFII